MSLNSAVSIQRIKQFAGNVHPARLFSQSWLLQRCAGLGLQARLMSQALRKLTAIVSKTKTVVIFINQIRMQIGVMFGNPETTPGGKALKFYTSVRLDIRKIAQIKKGDEIMGVFLMRNGRKAIITRARREPAGKLVHRTIRNLLHPIAAHGGRYQWTMGSLLVAYSTVWRGEQKLKWANVPNEIKAAIDERCQHLASENASGRGCKTTFTVGQSTTEELQE
mgnify:CR=1 FL=1